MAHRNDDNAEATTLGRVPPPVELGPSLRVVGEGVDRVISLPTKGKFVIGRGVDADVRVDDPSISRHHAMLTLGARTTVKDLDSANGTRVGGRLLEAGEEVALEPGEVVDLGAVMVVYRGAPEPTTPAPDADPMVRLRHLVGRVAAGRISVLIQGETGAGKEVLAEDVHRRSPRASKPFLRLNCGGFTETLLESELFGHERGAFTGADRAKPGLLETADGGTVFLDEIGELPPALQVRLLRVLQDRKVLRVGALEPREIDVRFVAATNRDLEAEVAAGRFRADLFHRLSGIVLRLPPLRERRGEIADLARRFVDEAARENGRPKVRLGKAALARLEAMPWPGNIRELKNVVERAVLLAPGDEITPDDLALEDAAPQAHAAGGLPDEVDALERRRIVEALEACGGNQSRAAKALGISRGTLLARIKQYGLKRPRG